MLTRHHGAESLQRCLVPTHHYCAASALVLHRTSCLNFYSTISFLNSSNMLGLLPVKIKSSTYKHTINIFMFCTLICSACSYRHLMKFFYLKYLSIRAFQALGAWMGQTKGYFAKEICADAREPKCNSYHFSLLLYSSLVKLASSFFHPK